MSRRRPLSKKVLVELHARVEAGAAYLSVLHPMWWKFIDPTNLDLSSNETCIIGQIEGRYDDGRKVYGLAENGVQVKIKGNGEISQAEAFGLICEEEKWAMFKPKYTELTRLWKLKIAALKRKNKKK